MKTKITWSLIAIPFLITTCFGCGNNEKNNEDKNIFEDSRDGNKYKIVIIGDQTWLAENLRFKTNGGSFSYNNNIINDEKSGRLYIWKVAKNVCPDGWRLPTKSDFIKLLTKYGNPSEFQFNKYVNQLIWDSAVYDSIAINQLDEFQAQLGGYCSSISADLSPFYGLGKEARYWTSSLRYASRPWILQLYSDGKKVTMFDQKEDCGFSVRCVKTDTNQSTDIEEMECESNAGIYRGHVYMGYIVGDAEMTINEDCSAVLQYDMGYHGSATERGRLNKFESDYRWVTYDDEVSYYIFCSGKKIILKGNGWGCELVKCDSK